VPGTPFLEWQGICNLSIGQVRIDNGIEPKGIKSKYMHSVSSGLFLG